MLYQPEAHEPLTEEAWSPELVRAGIRAIAAETEAAFDGGWRAHPLDELEGRPRGIYLGGAGVVDALRRLAARGLAECRRDYAPYLEHLLDAPGDFPEHDPRRSLWMGETGVRLVLQRLAPSAENLAALAALISENARDERRELMWGSPGTMLVARELGLDELWAESADWLRRERDPDGVWEQHLYGSRRRFLGPAHGFAGCVLALEHDPLAGEVARRFAVVEDGLANWPPLADGDLVAGDGFVRTQWCHGAPGIVASLGDLLDEDLALAGGELVWQRARSSRARASATGRPGTATRSSRCSRGRTTSAGSPERGPSRCTPSDRSSSPALRTAAVATRSGPATSEPRSTSPTPSTAEARRRSRSQPTSSMISTSSSRR